jgi:hypothetical protein
MLTSPGREQRIHCRPCEYKSPSMSQLVIFQEGSTLVGVSEKTNIMLVPSQTPVKLRCKGGFEGMIDEAELTQSCMLIYLRIK